MSHAANTPADTPRHKPLLEVRDLTVRFEGERNAPLRPPAVDAVSWSLFPSQTLAVVGESGCGKSVTAMSVLRLNPVPPARYESGRILYQDPDAAEPVDLLSIPEKRLRSYRGGDIAMIFQEPMTSLNPVLTIGDQIIEAILLHQKVSASDAVELAKKAMDEVGITDAARRLRSYPHEFSGGMRQRVMIAMALACRPRVLLADEPTTALDVTIQAQILDLIASLREKRGLGVVLITHSLGLVAEQADVACVMYGGRVVEYATVPDLFERPLHPYTRGLLRCIPSVSAGTGGPRGRLSTIADLMKDRDEFERGVEGVGKDARAWWPGHTAPAGTAGGGSALVRAQASSVHPHWVRVWRSGPFAEANQQRPSIEFRRDGALTEPRP
ncbi:MAG: ABC transporter ATP-binding protein [Phycisphaerales bacterium]